MDGVRNYSYHYKESPARPKGTKASNERESVSITPLLAAGIGWMAGDYLFLQMEHI